jgi:hypothetical protein
MSKTTFLFWNINCVLPRDPDKRSQWEAQNYPRLLNLLNKLTAAVYPDILVLAESTIPAGALSRSLPGYHLADDLAQRVKIWTRFPAGIIQPVLDKGEKIAFRRVNFPKDNDLLFGAVHLRSKLHQDSQEQIIGTPRLRRYIEEAECNVGHSRTVVFGDFNMNPWEPGFVGADGLHAMMDRHIAENMRRTVEGEVCSYFYNPMWNHFGRLSQGPPGTYYYPGSTQINYFWNMFDQVILRPDLLSRFDDGDTQILTMAGPAPLLDSVPLLGREKPFRPVQSDHLPLMFKISH